MLLFSSPEAKIPCGAVPEFNRCHLGTREGVGRRWGKSLGSEIQGNAFRAIDSLVPRYCVANPTLVGPRVQRPNGLCRGPKKPPVSYPFNLSLGVSASLSSASACLPCTKSQPCLWTLQECLFCSSGCLGARLSGRWAGPSLSLGR